MKLYRFDSGVGEEVRLFHSSGFVISRIARLSESAIVNCAYLAPHGVIGYHQTTADQLFLVLEGEGWVRGAEPDRTKIQKGQAAHWVQGEWHESGTETGLAAILLEGAKFDLSRLTLLN